MYQCEICLDKSFNKLKIEKCEARGRQEFPIGLLRGVSNWYEGRSEEIYAIVGSISTIHTHYFFANEISCLDKCNNLDVFKVQELQSLDAYVPSELTQSQKDSNAFKRMIEFLKSKNILPMIWVESSRSCIELRCECGILDNSKDKHVFSNL